MSADAVLVVLLAVLVGVVTADLWRTGERRLAGAVAVAILVVLAMAFAGWLD